MWKRFSRWIISLWVLGFLWLPVALAARPRQEPEPETSRSFPFAYTVALVGTMIVMVILCAPSRKAWRD